MIIKTSKHLFQWVWALCLLTACAKEDTPPPVKNPFLGEYAQKYVNTLNGFGQDKERILSYHGVTKPEFIVWSTDSAWHLTNDQRHKLKAIRESVISPTTQTLLQKVIPLEEVIVYMNNVYGGTIGGFVTSAADTKKLITLHDIYHGLRLDYPGTKFKVDGAGYAVIRFISPSTDKLTIPYCIEMGGTNTHAWPSTGGGFTASPLGEGGYPEYQFIGYYAPQVGAELYEVTPNGTEILRSTFHTGRWITFEKEGLTKQKSTENKHCFNGTFALYNNTTYEAYEYHDGTIELVCDIPTDGFEQHPLSGRYFKKVDKNIKRFTLQTLALYKEYQFEIKGLQADTYYLTTRDEKAAAELQLQAIERGIYQIKVSVNEVDKIWREQKDIL